MKFESGSGHVAFAAGDGKQFQLMPFDTHLQTISTDAAWREPTTRDGEESVYLLVRLRGALYGIEAADVSEVQALPALRALPQAPAFVRGVVKVRGEIVPVVDLAARLGHQPEAPRLSDGLVLLRRNPSQNESSKRDATSENATGENATGENATGENATGENAQVKVEERVNMQQVALCVEEVCDIASFQNAQIEAAPFAIEYSMATRMASWKGEIVLLLDISQFFDASQLMEADRNAPRATPAATDYTEWPLDAATRAIFQARAERLAALPDAIRQSETERDVTFGATAIARVVVGGEERGVLLTQVREFCALSHFAPVPCCPPHILGQMNLRGEIVTLLDIAPQLGLSRTQSDWANGQVVVTSLAHEGDEEGLIGIVVEDVRDVLQLRADEMREVAASSRAADKLCGAVLRDERWIPILDLPSLLSNAALVVDEMV